MIIPAVHGEQGPASAGLFDRTSTGTPSEDEASLGVSTRMSGLGGSGLPSPQQPWGAGARGVRELVGEREGSRDGPILVFVYSHDRMWLENYAMFV